MHELPSLQSRLLTNAHAPLPSHSSMVQTLESASQDVCAAAKPLVGHCLPGGTCALLGDVAGAGRGPTYCSGRGDVVCRACLAGDGRAVLARITHIARARAAYRRRIGDHVRRAALTRQAGAALVRILSHAECPRKELLRRFSPPKTSRRHHECRPVHKTGAYDHRCASNGRASRRGIEKLRGLLWGRIVKPFGSAQSMRGLTCGAHPRQPR